MRKIKALFIMSNVEPLVMKIPREKKFIKNLIGKELHLVKLKGDAYIVGNKKANIDDFNRRLGDSILLGSFLIVNMRNKKLYSLDKYQIRRYTSMFCLKKHQKTLDKISDLFAKYTLKMIKNYYANNSKTESISNSKKFLDNGTNIIKVKFEDTYYPGTFASREYTYFSKLDLKLGDIVECPTVNGFNYGKVTALTQGLSISEFEKNLNYEIKEIVTKVDKDVFLSKAS